MATWAPHFTNTYRHEPYAALTSNHASGKVAIITGGGSGIGKATAIEFARASAKAIILIGRTESRLEAAKEELEQIFHKQGDFASTVLIYSADITDAGSVKSAFQHIAGRFHSIDALVNNAGHLPDLKLFSQSDLTNWWQGYETNIRGTANIVEAFIPIAAPSASLINITSNLAHLNPFPGASAYAPAKMATIRLMEYIQKENEHLRVFNLHPGLITTEMSAKGDVGSEDTIELPARLCTWLLDPRADFLKGRLVWSNWDVEELEARKEEIIDENLLTVGLRGL